MIETTRIDASHTATPSPRQPSGVHHAVPIQSTVWKWSRLALLIPFCLALASCGTTPQTPEADSGGKSGTWAGARIGSAPASNARLKQAMISRATREWEFFDRQTVVLKGSEESIPHVGSWEDDGGRHSGRVNAYWRAVGKPRLDGMDCQQPWSAAFMSWVMQSAGVPESQFRRSDSHWVYLASMIDEAGYPGRWFVPRRIMDYSPQPGDLICASRGTSRPRTINGYTSARALNGASTHCDLVVAKTPRTLEAIGGNVRNSVSRTTLELDGQGRLQPAPRRPWFLIMENRL